MESFIFASLPIAGITVGAVLQYFFNKNSNMAAQQAALRNEAYVDYLRSMAKSAHVSSLGDRKEAIMNAADAKARIAVYGSASVISALAQFEDAGPQLNNKHSIDCFLILAETMRKKKIKSKDDLLKILVGIEGTNKK